MAFHVRLSRQDEQVFAGRLAQADPAHYQYERKTGGRFQ
jgi:hypothetical protein